MTTPAPTPAVSSFGSSVAAAGRLPFGDRDCSLTNTVQSSSPRQSPAPPQRRRTVNNISSPQYRRVAQQMYNHNSTAHRHHLHRTATSYPSPVRVCSTSRHLSRERDENDACVINVTVDRSSGSVNVHASKEQERDEYFMRRKSQTDLAPGWDGSMPRRHSSKSFINPLKSKAKKTSRRALFLDGLHKNQHDGARIVPDASSHAKKPGSTQVQNDGDDWKDVEGHCTNRFVFDNGSKTFSGIQRESKADAGVLTFRAGFTGNTTNRCRSQKPFQQPPSVTNTGHRNQLMACARCAGADTIMEALLTELETERPLSNGSSGTTGVERGWFGVLGRGESTRMEQTVVENVRMQSENEALCNVLHLIRKHLEDRGSVLRSYEGQMQHS